MKLIVFLVAVVLLFPSSVKAQSWSHIGKSSKGEDWYMYDKTASGTLMDSYGVWFKYKSTVVTTVKGKKYYKVRETKQLIEVKCSSGELCITEIIVYNSKGDVISSSKRFPEFSPTVPDSMREQLLNAACSLRSSENILGY